MNQIKNHLLVREPHSREDMSRYSIVPRSSSRLYEVKFKDYLSFINFGEYNNKPDTFSSELFRDDGKYLAYMYGSISAPNSIASMSHLNVVADQDPKKDKIRYVVEITAATEMAFADFGIKHARTNTHNTMAYIMGTMGWKNLGKRGTTNDIEKEIDAGNIIIPDRWDL